MKRQHIRIALLLTVGAALALRVAGLDRRPMHHDEANQAVRCGILQETGEYEYDPVEHHGPSLYYLSLPFAWTASGRDFAGTSEVTFRLVSVVAGMGVVLLVFLLADGVGWPAAIFGALLTAVSPAMVYYSGFYIQEMTLVFFTFGVIACGWRYWRTGKPAWAIAAGMFAGMMHATKETCVIAYAAMIPAGIIAACATYRASRHRDRPRPGANDRSAPGAVGSGYGRPTATPPPGGGSSSKDLFSRRPVLSHFLAAGFTAALVSVLFYSSFLAHWRGVIDSVLTYKCYLQKAGAARDHIHPWYYYLKMLAFSRYGEAAPVWSEAFIMALAAVGCAGAVMPKRAGFADAGLLRFLALYCVLLTAAYSIIPYKTPWCLLSFLQAMIVLAGVGAIMLMNLLRRIPVKVVLGVAMAAGCVHLAWQAHLATTRHCADPKNPYVYAHTSLDFLGLARRINEIADISPEGRSMLMAVVTNPQDCWPLPWYLRGFDRVGYWTDPDTVPDLPDPSVIVVSPDPPGFEDAVMRSLDADYQTEFYGLRPGVFLSVHIRNDLWKAFLRTRQ